MKDHYKLKVQPKPTLPRQMGLLWLYEGEVG